MATSNRFKHSSSDKFGENIFMSGNILLSDSDAVKEATKEWYSEVSTYNYNNPGISMATGHFTQVVWKNSKNLGIGVARSLRGVYVCANYDPPGNFKGQFPQNVLRP